MGIARGLGGSYRVQEGVGSGRGSRRGWGFSVCGSSTYRQVKFLGKILQHCYGNSFSFLKWSGGGQEVQGGLSKGDTG